MIPSCCCCTFMLVLLYLNILEQKFHHSLHQCGLNGRNPCFVAFSERIHICSCSSQSDKLRSGTSLCGPDPPWGIPCAPESRSSISGGFTVRTAPRVGPAEQGGTPNTAVGVDLPAFGMSLWIYSPSSFGVMVDSYLESPGVLIDLNSMQVLFLGARHTSAYAYSNDILKR